jgi:hypothetical protein
MIVTLILRDKTEVFYHGGGHFQQTGLLNLAPRAQFDELQRLTREHLASMRVGPSNAFRDIVELNQLLRANQTPTFKLEPRRGYKLATFEF